MTHFVVIWIMATTITDYSASAYNRYTGNYPQTINYSARIEEFKTKTAAQKFIDDAPPTYQREMKLETLDEPEP